MYTEIWNEASLIDFEANEMKIFIVTQKTRQIWGVQEQQTVSKDTGRGGSAKNARGEIDLTDKSET